MFVRLLQEFRAQDADQNGVLSIAEVQRAVQMSGFQLEQQAFYEACKV
jgi:Ca2+-binding EF-hand superfamily protein